MVNCPGIFDPISQTLNPTVKLSVFYGLWQGELNKVVFKQFQHYHCNVLVLGKKIYPLVRSTRLI